MTYSARHKSNANFGNLVYDYADKRAAKNLLCDSCDPRVGSKRFFNEVINLFGPTRGSNTSRITNSSPLFYLLNHTLNFQNWRLICVLQYSSSLKKISTEIK